MKIKICGVPYEVCVVDEIPEQQEDQVCFGDIDHVNLKISLRKSCQEVMNRTFIHEVLHGIILGLDIRELQDEGGSHRENVIEQLTVGLAEAFESVGLEIWYENNYNT